ncbi:MAG TPA: DUF1802 family protein [Elusimicrobiota bacterium]|nr:DUF1802 family protein [Elusimicrobiota bacterium]
MKSQNDKALKEWAVVERALREGWQVFVLAGEGVAEESGAPAWTEEEFFICKTYDRQTPEALKEKFHEWPYDAERLRAPQGELNIESYARVDSLVKVADLEALKRVLPHTVWSESHLRKSFESRRPLYLAFLRCYRTPHPLRVSPPTEQEAPSSPWLTLKEPLSPTNFYPVFSPEVFAEKKKKVLDSLNGA